MSEVDFNRLLKRWAVQISSTREDKSGVKECDIGGGSFATEKGDRLVSGITKSGLLQIATDHPLTAKVLMGNSAKLDTTRCTTAADILDMDDFTDTHSSVYVSATAARIKVPAQGKPPIEFRAPQSIDPVSFGTLVWPQRGVNGR
jgi:hypothetical protein